MPWILILLILAFLCFAVPAVRALIRSSIDYTNTGLALVTLAWIIGGAAI
jgi:hypothetical protein